MEEVSLLQTQIDVNGINFCMKTIVSAFISDSLRIFVQFLLVYFLLLMVSLYFFVCLEEETEAVSKNNFVI